MYLQYYLPQIVSANFCISVTEDFWYKNSSSISSYAIIIANYICTVSW